jgi:ABC-type nitrate/sulfonate/bicarbonate transport system substrate-binding protein
VRADKTSTRQRNLIKENKMTGKLLSWVLLLLALVVAPRALSQEKKLEPLHVSYVSVSASRAPLWIAKEMGLYEKYGLDVRLVVIRGTQVPITALVSGDIQIIAAPATGTMVAAARGLPVVVIGTFGPSTFKLVSQPSITSISELKGKTIGISQLTNTDDFTARRLLLKFGLLPGKDVNILGTGLTESGKRMALMLQGGRFDATLATPDTIYELESWVLQQMLSYANSFSDIWLVTSTEFAQYWLEKSAPIT